jgi:hypothetical protein
MHLKAMAGLGDGLGLIVGVGTLVDGADGVGVEEGSGVAHPATRRQSSAGARVFIAG